jgi:hypothetical protein
MPVEQPAPAPVPARVPVPGPQRVLPVSPAPVAPVPAASKALSASDLAALYRSVGQTLDRVGDDALWQRYRWIRLGDYLATPGKRAEAARMLDAIASDARGK